MLFRGSEQFGVRTRSTTRSRAAVGRCTPRPAATIRSIRSPLHPSELPRRARDHGRPLHDALFSDIDLERKIIIEEILEASTRTSQRQRRRLSRGDHMGDHPLGFPITGPLGNVKRFRTRDVRAHFARFTARPTWSCAWLARSRTAGSRRWPPAPSQRLPGPTRRGHGRRVAGSGRVFRALDNESSADPGAAGVGGNPGQRSGLRRAVPPGARARRRHVDPAARPDLAIRRGSLPGVGGIEPLHDAALLEVDAAWRRPEASRVGLRGPGHCSRVSVRISCAYEDLNKAKRRYPWGHRGRYDDLDVPVGLVWRDGAVLQAAVARRARAALQTRSRRPDLEGGARRVLDPKRLTVARVGTCRQPSRVASGLPSGVSETTLMPPGRRRRRQAHYIVWSFLEAYSQLSLKFVLSMFFEFSASPRPIQ